MLLLPLLAAVQYKNAIIKSILRRKIAPSKKHTIFLLHAHTNPFLNKTPTKNNYYDFSKIALNAFVGQLASSIVNISSLGNIAIEETILFSLINFSFRFV